MSNKYPGGVISLGGPESNSNYFNGSAYLSIANNAALDLGTGDFTIEGWWNFSDTSNQALISKYSSGQGFVVQYQSSNLRLVLGLGSGTDAVYAFSWTPVVGTWYHIAITRSGTSGRAFVNGFQIGSTTTVTTSNTTSSTSLQIGLTHTVSEYTRGFASNVRTVKGTALYAANFVPPTGPLQNITNTTLLTCQSPTIIDNSSNTWTITNTSVTVNANTPLTAYNPNTLNPALGAATNGVWNMPQALAAEVTRSWPMYDPYYNQVVLNLHGNQPGGVVATQNNTFLDSSSNNFTITRNGNTTQGSFNPYRQSGYWSNYFASASSSILSIANNAAFNFGAPSGNTNDFTVEFFAFPTATGIISPVFTGYTTGFWGFNFNRTTGGANTVGYVQFYMTDSFNVTASSGLVANQWNHIAAVRTGTTVTIFINGVSSATATSSVDPNPTGPLWIGGEGTFLGRYLDGYISNLRIIKGSTQPYSAAASSITVPTKPLSAITGTTVLTCQSNRFIDNSSNALAITAYGSSSAQAFQPFNQNLPYESSRLGGSGYFNGSSFLYGTTLWNPGTTDFSVEAWAYFSTTSGDTNYRVILSNYSGGNGYIVGLYTTGTPKALWFDPVVGNILGATTLNANTWYHIAVTRVSGNIRVFLNGVLDAYATGSTYSIGAGSTSIGEIPAASQTGYMNGYMTDLRCLSGGIPSGYSTASTTVGASIFAPPTAPLTAITNTQLLMNYTNAGIFDNAAMNDLETVGGAAVSTTQSKYGGASMYFDYSASYLTSQFVAPQNLGTGDFTIEMWAYWSSLASTTGLFNKSYTTDGNTWQGMHAFVSTAGTINFETNDTLSNSTTGARISASSNVSTGVWYHIAFVRSAGTTKIYLNGVSVGSGSNSGSCDNTYGFVVAKARPNTTWYMNGYLDDFRVTKGVARYLANFQPPTSQLQDQ